MFITAEIPTEYNIINLEHVAAIGIFDDPNGKYFMVNFQLAGGQKITWKYDDKKKRDAKVTEAQSSK
jgi:hypothetical protein